MKLLILPLLFLLAGCASERVQCLPEQFFKPYTPQQQKTVSKELAKLPENSETKQFILDYADLWKAEKICLKE